jgi:glutamate N-acetyltransferase/amino-acid N-acetyltransferase
MVADGEGVEHVIELRIEGAPTDDDALRIARSVANSPLVKTAWAGTDPNWGRILAATGYAGVPLDPARISIHFNDLEICHAGGLSPSFDEIAAHAILVEPEFSITINLNLGAGSCRFWTCDLTEEYVKINADYST